MRQARKVRRGHKSGDGREGRRGRGGDGRFELKVAPDNEDMEEDEREGGAVNGS